MSKRKFMSEPPSEPQPQPQPQPSAAVVMAQHLLGCRLLELHEFLLARAGPYPPSESGFDINACLPLKPPPKLAPAVEEEEEGITGCSTLLYWAIRARSAERVALLLLFGANPLAPAVRLSSASSPHGYPYDERSGVDVARQINRDAPFIRILVDPDADVNVHYEDERHAFVPVNHACMLGLVFSLMWLLDVRKATVHPDTMHYAIAELEQMRRPCNLRIVEYLIARHGQDATPLLKFYPFATEMLQGPRARMRFG